MPPRKTASPASALGLDAPEQSAVRSPAPPGGGGGGSPSGANQASNASAGISAVGRGVATAGRYLEASEEQQRAVRKRNEAERIQGAAEARADRGGRDINRWQFSNSPNYRNEYKRLLKSHYDAKLSGVRRSLATTKDPEAVKGLTKYLETLQKNHATETNAIYGDDAERPDRLEDSKELFRNATLDVRGRLTDLGFAEHRNLLREIDAREGITPEQRYEEAQQVGEAVADSYFPDDDEREHFLRITGSANDALLRNEQTELRKAQFDKQAAIINEEGGEIVESLGRKTHKLFEVGEDGKVSTNGNVLTEFLAEGEILGQFTLPRYDENGEFINEPAYNEKAINAILSPLIGDALVQHAGRSGDNGLAEQIEAQDFKWREHRIDENGNSEVVEFQLDTDIAERIRNAGGRQAVNQARKEVADTTTIMTELAKHTPLNPSQKDERIVISNILQDGGDRTSGRIKAIRVFNSESFIRAHNEYNPVGRKDWRNFARKIATGEILPELNDIIKEGEGISEREAVLNEIEDSLEKIDLLPDAEKYEALTGDIYPPYSPDYPTNDEVRSLLLFYRKETEYTEEKAILLKTFKNNLFTTASLIAAGLPIPKTRLELYGKILRETDDPEVITNIWEQISSGIASGAGPNADGYYADIGVGRAETIREIRKIRNPRVKTFLLSAATRQEELFSNRFYNYEKNKKEIVAGITFDIKNQFDEAREAEFIDFDLSYMTTGDNPLWNIDIEAKDLFKKAFTQQIQDGTFEEGRDYDVDDGELTIHSTENTQEISVEWFDLLAPPKEAPYLLHLNENAEVIGLPKMYLPDDRESQDTLQMLTAVRNLIFDPELRTHPMNQFLEEGAGESGNVEVNRFINTIKGVRNHTEISPGEIILIPSEEGIRFAYPTSDGEKISFPTIIPWDFFNSNNFLDEMGVVE